MVARAVARSDADSFGRLDGADVLVGYPSLNEPDLGQARTFTQMFPLVGGGDGPAVGERKKLFQNVVCWLLRCYACPAVGLSFDYTPKPAVAQTGSPFTLHLYVNNNGECPGTAVIARLRLAEGLQFVGAETPRGQVSHTNGLVTFRIGQLASGEPLDLLLTLCALVPGSLTNMVELRANAVPPITREVVVEAQGDRVPTLAIRQLQPSGVTLKILAQPGVRYALERSISVTGAIPLPWTVVSNFVFALPAIEISEPIGDGASAAFYRVRARP